MKFCQMSRIVGLTKILINFNQKITGDQASDYYLNFITDELPLYIYDGNLNHIYNIKR